MLNLPHFEVLNHLFLFSLSQKLGSAKKFGKLDAADIDAMSSVVQALAAAMHPPTDAAEQA